MNGVSRALVAAALALPVVCTAQPSSSRPQESSFDYSYVELEYAETEFGVPGGGDIDGDGFGVEGSFELNDEWHAFAAYGNADLDFGVDLDSWLIGAGYVFPLQDDLDVYGRVMYVKMDADVPGPDPDDDGLGLQVRVRGRVNDQFEVEGGVQYLNVDDSDTSLQAEGRYYFRDDFSVGLGLTFGGDTDGIAVSARYSF
jgi:hypothetical protein